MIPRMLFLIAAVVLPIVALVAAVGVDACDPIELFER